MAVKGVDISEHNGEVDFAALKRAGVAFVLLRCGYGGDYPGQDDECWENNLKKAEETGMPWGAYLYSYAKNKEMAQSEARHTLRLLAGRKPPYGVWYDVEDPQQVGADLVSICETYGTAIEAQGLYCGIYSSLNWLEHKLNSPRLDRFDKWVAQWNSLCEYQKPYGIWQFTNGWQIAGKRFDGNWAYKDYPALTGAKEEEGPPKAKSRVFSEQGNSVTQPFGNGHGGVDLGWDKDPETPVVAHSPGRVVFCQTGQKNDTGSSGNASYGNCVKLEHENGWHTLYAHMSAVKVKYGERVPTGRQIGNMGNTGNSYGNHLHFEVRNSGGTRVDPVPYLTADLPGLPTKEEEKEEAGMTYEQWKAYQEQYERELAAKPTSKWAEEAVAYCRARGIMNGDANGRFRPQSLITRQEAAQLMKNLGDRLAEEA